MPATSKNNERATSNNKQHAHKQRPVHGTIGTFCIHTGRLSSLAAETTHMRLGEGRQHYRAQFDEKSAKCH